MNQVEQRNGQVNDQQAIFGKHMDKRSEMEYHEHIRKELIRQSVHNGNLNLKFYLEVGGFLEITLLDFSGDLIYNYSDYVNRGSFFHIIRKQFIRNGKYLLRVASNGNSRVFEVSL